MSHPLPPSSPQCLFCPLAQSQIAQWYGHQSQHGDQNRGALLKHHTWYARTTLSMYLPQTASTHDPNTTVDSGGNLLWIRRDLSSFPKANASLPPKRHHKWVWLMSQLTSQRTWAAPLLPHQLLQRQLIPLQSCWMMYCTSRRKWMMPWFNFSLLGP